MPHWFPVIRFVGHSSLFAFLCYASLSPSGDEFNNISFSLSVALTAQAKTTYVVSIFFRHVLRETYVAYLPAHTHNSVKHALLSTPSVESLFPRRSFSIRWGKFGGFHCCSCCGLFHPRGVRRVWPPLLQLLLSVFVTLLVLSSLLPPLHGALYIFLVVHGSTNCGFFFSSSSSFH